MFQLIKIKIHNNTNTWIKNISHFFYQNNNNKKWFWQAEAKIRDNFYELEIKLSLFFIF